MRPFVLFAILIPTAALASTPKERVRVIENVPTNSTYNWWVDGRSSVSCHGGDCVGYYSAPAAGKYQVSGALLKLLKSDGTIVIAECLAKERVAADVMASLSGVGHSNTYRSCRMPEPGSQELDAEFHTSSIKINFSNPHIDPSGRIFSETYLIKGFLHPKPSDKVLGSSSFTQEDGDRNMACGPLKTKMKVNTNKKDHPIGNVQLGQALVYIIQQDEFTVKVLGYFPTRVAIDNRWIGGNHSDSYFFFPVTPGEHQVCAEWEIEFSHHILPVSFAKFTANAGETYYMRTRVIFAGLEGERSIKLEPISAAEAQELIAKSGYSEQK